MKKPPIYSEIDSVGNDFLAVQDAILNNEEVNTEDYFCIYNDFIVEYDDEGMVYVTYIAQEWDSYSVNFDSEYWTERTTALDCTACNDATELYHFFRTEIKPILI